LGQKRAVFIYGICWEREGVQVSDEASLYNIMELSEETLKQVLPKVSMRMISRLIASYPRAVGRTLMNAMSETMSPFTMEMLREEMSSGKIPSLQQIREAEKEFLKTLYDEKILSKSAA
jgi:hypothetical protein